MQPEHTSPTFRLIAIVRGLRPEESLGIAAALIEAGISTIEVPLNSPDPFTSIELIAREFGDVAMIGAGTVLQKEDCSRLQSAGGRLVVSPNCDPDVIRHAKSLGLAVYPGVATPTEAFRALGAGSDGLKLFPFETLGIQALKAWKAVLPPKTALFPVGGVTPETIPELAAAGAAGVGIGSALYKAGMARDEVSKRARSFVDASRGV